MCAVEPFRDLDLRGSSLRGLPALGKTWAPLADPLTLMVCDLSGADLRALDMHG